MGTQQILLIVLSVIIVGAAIAVGITMFTTQAVNSARQAVLMDMNNFAAQALQYYRTPTSLGGAGYAADFDPADLAKFIDQTATGDSVSTPNGGYQIAISSADTSVTFTSVPNEPGLADNPPTLTIKLSTGDITANPGG
ncbi:MAG: hypothetical protein ACP5EQ_07300 [Candidatus Cloacimonadia bacterium]